MSIMEDKGGLTLTLALTLGQQSADIEMRRAVGSPEEVTSHQV